MAITNGSLPILQASPYQIDFGSVAYGSSATQSLRFFNASNSGSIQVEGVTSSDPNFVLSGLPTFPIVLNPVQGFTLTVTFTAPATLGPYSATITAESDADNNPSDVPATATSAATGTGLLSVNPSRWVFPTTKQGVNSPSQTFIVTNTGTVNVTVSTIAFTGPFTGGLPTLPVTLTPGGTLMFTAWFTPAGRGYVVVPNAITITSDATGSPLLVDLEGTGVAITPAYVVVGGAENGYTAFGSILRQFQATNFDCEAEAFAQKWIQPEQGMEATLQRVLFQFEDMGLAKLQVFARATRYSTINAATTEQIAQQTINVGSSAAAGAVFNAMADVVVQGNTIQLGFVPTGPIFLVSYDPEVVPAGEVKKS